MRRIIPLGFVAILISFIVCNKANGQFNLVPNPSFEDTVSCPTTANQIDKAVGWHASRESPDYFNQCDFITGNTSVPENFTGYQYARSGVAYAGFIAFYYPFPNGREFFSCQLNSPLQIGHKYNISFYVSWSAGASDLIACNKLGANFSLTNHLASVNPQPILNSAHIYSDSIIQDSLGWTKIGGSFIADSSYLFFTIGNFFSDSQTDTIMPGFPSADAYYYIDDINVSEDTTTSIKQNDRANSIIISPNPCYNQIHLNNIKPFKSIFLYAMNSELIGQFAIPDNDDEMEINLSIYSKGFYVMKFANDRNEFFYCKLLKL